MTRDDVILMARKAGFEVHPRKEEVRIGADALMGLDSTPKLERFAALVAAKARHTPGVVNIAVEALEQERARGYRHGVAAEREACAQAAEAFHRHGYDFTGNLELHEWLRARPTGHKEST